MSKRNPWRESAIGMNLAKTSPCTSSYWCGATREQLAAGVQARRHQQEVPSNREALYDPMLSATLALSLRGLMRRSERRRLEIAKLQSW